MVTSDFVFFATNRTQMEAADGLMQVDPLLDDEIVSLVASFPQHLLLFGDQQRGLFRHATRHLLPDRLRLRRDKARFESAITEMVRGADLPVLRDLANVRMSADLGLVEPLGYRAAFETALSAPGDTADWIGVWPVLAVEAYLRAQWSVRKEGP
jgi:hypothetical protein